MSTPNEPPSTHVEHTHFVRHRRSRQVAKTPDKRVGKSARYEDDRAKMPENRVGEWGLVIAKAAATLIPFAGGPDAEVLGAILQPQIEKRKTEWIEGTVRDLHALSQHVDGLTPERLSQSPEFATAFMHASTIAIRTHQREKLEALRNAVLNVAAGTAPDDNLRLTFLNAIDALTPLHLEFLDCIAEPLAWADKRHYPVYRQQQIDARSIFEATHRETLVSGFDQVLLQDLYNRGLAANDFQPGAYGGGSGPETMFPHITEIGRRFLAFITSPLQDVDVSDDTTPRRAGP